ncbi:MAG: putative nucleotidyltransferase substrate binding domain-containing protein [Desulfobulbaceae bacterium]|nr:putative nucleotidyltransferase substrate binding domain-containing protein [Desulfobulbaceae bacterium]
MAENEQNFIPVENVVSFLSNTLPFNRLSPDELHRLAKKCVIDFFPKGTMIFNQGLTTVNFLYLIQKGGVKSYLKNEQGELTLNDYRGEGEYFGALPIIQETKANLNVETVEDSFCFLIGKKDFQALLAQNAEVSQYFLRTMSAKLVKGVYAELRQHKIAPRTDGALYLFSAPVEEIAKGKLYTAPTNATVKDVAQIMSENFIGSLLLKDETDTIVGIITDKDLRTKVVAKGLDFATLASEIMASPVQTISSQAMAFDALLKMMKEKVHHLAIEKNGQILKMITTHDIMVEQGTSPLYLFREIVAQRRIEDLYPLAQKVPFVIRTLIEEGAKANNITRMITVLNDHILDRLLSLMVKEMGEPPLPFCWLSMGSEGRREQTFKTDQDNAILYQDSENPKVMALAEDYFKAFARTAIDHLVQCGYPLCPGEIMATNPKWRQPLSTWEHYFKRWCGVPEPQEILHSTIFFDFRPGFGNSSLAERLRQLLTGIAQQEDIFLLHLARNCLSSKPPLSFFKNFIVEKNGEHKNTFDLKRKAMVFFVDFARLMALKHGVNETNTLDRLRILSEGQYLPQGMYAEIIEAYEFLMQLRLVHQLQMLEDGKQPDNYINPGDLSDLERQTLKEAFAVINRLQDSIRMTFQIRE